MSSWTLVLRCRRPNFGCYMRRVPRGVLADHMLDTNLELTCLELSRTSSLDVGFG